MVHSLSATLRNARKLFRPLSFSKEATDHRASMLAKVKGQTIEIPDLVELIYHDWRVERHPDEAQVRMELEEEFAVRYGSQIYDTCSM